VTETGLDLVLTEWVKEGSEEKRNLTYVMHMVSPT
jgi:hypothetical protein